MLIICTVWLGSLHCLGIVLHLFIILLEGEVDCVGDYLVAWNPLKVNPHVLGELELFLQRMNLILFERVLCHLILLLLWYKIHHRSKDVVDEA